MKRILLTVHPPLSPPCLRRGRIRIGLALTVLVTLLSGCSLFNPGPPPNPFEGNNPPQDTILAPVDELEPASIEGLHARIFFPTCANSGCHDGTFEPDFRTIESAYNTMVWHPIVKNDPGGNYEFRVTPGALGTSVLWNRLNEDIDGQSGIMPLVVDQDSDWNDLKATHLANIKAWIEGGAKDIFGNPPVNGDLKPSLRGMVAFPAGNTSTAISRDGGNGPVKVSAGTNGIDVWFSLVDDKTAANALLYNKVKVSANPDDFSGAAELNLQIAGPITAKGLLGGDVSYTHKVSLSTSAYAAGSQIYLRVYVQEDASASITEIPTAGSAEYTKAYFSFLKK